MEIPDERTEVADIRTEIPDTCMESPDTRLKNVLTMKGRKHPDNSTSEAEFFVFRLFRSRM